MTNTNPLLPWSVFDFASEVEAGVNLHERTIREVIVTGGDPDKVPRVFYDGSRVMAFAKTRDVSLTNLHWQEKVIDGYMTQSDRDEIEAYRAQLAETKRAILKLDAIRAGLLVDLSVEKELAR